MNMTRKTFYGLGVVSSALNLLGGALLIFSIRMSLLFSLATVGAGAMMLLVATTQQEDAPSRNLSLAGAMLTAFGMAPGALGAIAAAVSWPVFAWQYGYIRSGTEIRDIILPLLHPQPMIRNGFMAEILMKILIGWWTAFF